MSTYLHFDHEEQGVQIASTAGWGDFVRWVESLDSGSYPELTALADTGKSEDPGRLEIEIELAIAGDEPTDSDTRSVVEELQKALQVSPARVVGVSSGLS